MPLSHLGFPQIVLCLSESPSFLPLQLTLVLSSTTHTSLLLQKSSHVLPALAKASSAPFKAGFSRGIEVWLIIFKEYFFFILKGNWQIQMDYAPLVSNCLYKLVFCILCLFHSNPSNSHTRRIGPNILATIFGRMSSLGHISTFIFSFCSSVYENSVVLLAITGKFYNLIIRSLFCLCLDKVRKDLLLPARHAIEGRVITKKNHLC